MLEICVTRCLLLKITDVLPDCLVYAQFWKLEYNCSTVNFRNICSGRYSFHIPFVQLQTKTWYYLLRERKNKEHAVPMDESWFIYVLWEILNAIAWPLSSLCTVEKICQARNINESLPNNQKQASKFSLGLFFFFFLFFTKWIFTVEQMMMTAWEFRS